MSSTTPMPNVVTLRHSLEVVPQISWRQSLLGGGFAGLVTGFVQRPCETCKVIIQETRVRGESPWSIQPRATMIAIPQFVPVFAMLFSFVCAIEFSANKLVKDAFGLLPGTGAILATVDHMMLVKALEEALDTLQLRALEFMSGMDALRRRAAEDRVEMLLAECCSLRSETELIEVEQHAFIKKTFLESAWFHSLHHASASWITEYQEEIARAQNVLVEEEHESQQLQVVFDSHAALNDVFLTEAASHKVLCKEELMLHTKLQYERRAEKNREEQAVQKDQLEEQRQMIELLNASLVELKATVERTNIPRNPKIKNMVQLLGELATRQAQPRATTLQKVLKEEFDKTTEQLNLSEHTLMALEQVMKESRSGTWTKEQRAARVDQLLASPNHRLDLAEGDCSGF